MTTNEKSTLLSSDGYLASYIDENGVGVTYFKLNPTPRFGADYTKGCGLLGEDIDKNFYFLRGYDISGVTIDEDKNLVITRVNPAYKPLKVNLAADIDYDFAFDKTTGTLTITDPNGDVTELDGFLVEGRDIRIATDHSLKGNGTVYKPLGVSEVEKTGTYAPADEYLDITETNVIPDEMQKGAGFRLVTKEIVDRFGKLYPFKAVEMIDAKLKESGSQWRVPTKADMDALLNALEPCEEDKNHSASTVGYLGRFAGAGMKSYDMWREFDEVVGEDPTDGQDTVSLSVYPLGQGTFRNSVMRDADHDTEGFRNLGTIWTSTEAPLGNAYAKTFAYNSAKVYQELANKESKRSIRLCKEYAYSNFLAEENILGLNYPCELVYSPISGSDYVMVWTKTNFCDASPSLSGVSSYQWDDVEESEKGTKEVYFINEWNGSEWVKKEMNDGDSVVIISYEAEDGTVVPYHEWRMENEVLVDTVKAIMDEFAETLDEINEKIDELSGVTADEIARAKARENEIEELVKSEIDRAKDVESQLWSGLTAEAEARAEVDNQQWNAINAEADARAEVDNQQWGAINAEATARESEDNRISQALEQEATARENEDNRISQALEQEATIRENEDNRISQALETETTARENEDNRISQALEQETIDRITIDNQQWDAINTERERATTRENEIENTLNEEISRAKAAEEAEAQTRFDNDITPGEYTIKANESITIPTNGTDVADLTINIEDEFFNFGEF